MQINSLLFLIVFLAYSTLSIYTFVLTTRGTESWLELMVNPIPVLLNVLLVLIGAAIGRQYFYPPRLFYFFILIIFFLHLACLVFNVGNYDAGGKGAFYYETVLAGWPRMFAIKSQFSQLDQGSVRFYLRITYYASILFFLISLISTRR